MRRSSGWRNSARLRVPKDETLAAWTLVTDKDYAVWRHGQAAH
jgi:hypothetical protein